jgi:hypothetical protein
MRIPSPLRRLTLIGIALAPGLLPAAQRPDVHVAAVADTALAAAPPAVGPELGPGPEKPLGTFERKLPRTRTDSIMSAETHAAAARDPAFRIIVSLADRRLWVLLGEDTLRSAPVAVGMDARLDFDGRVWIFQTPRGQRTVLAKRASPVWIPPDWHYAEVAREYGFRLRQLVRDRPVLLADGRRLEVRNDEAGLVGPDSSFAPLPTDEEIVFDSTLFIPPAGTKNRQIEGELGAYQLDMGDGYLLHGTPQVQSIGTATTHGCIRLHDEDIAWLYENVGVGTRVYIY